MQGRIWLAWAVLYKVMIRIVVYLIIFSVFAWTSLMTLVYLVSPFTSDGDANTIAVWVFVAVGSLAVALTTTLLLFIVKSLMPTHKLPHLMVRDSLIQGGVISLGATGVIVLQLLRAVSLLNVILWLAITGALWWIIQTLRAQEGSSQAPRTKSPILIRDEKSGRQRR